MTVRMLLYRQLHYRKLSTDGKLLDMVEDFPASGPYKLVSYDESSKTAVLEVNDKYIEIH